MRLKKEFSNFYDLIRIKEEVEALKEKREILQKDIENRLPGELEKHGIALKKSDIKIFDQGSYKYHTTIKSTVIDRDIAVKIPLDIEVNKDPRKIKTYLKDALNYVGPRTVLIKKPCITVTYSENSVEWMHIDFPMYAVHNNITYLARGKQNSDNYSWEIADPEGLNQDLCNKINKNDQLRRIIRFVKKWKNEKYANSYSNHEIPPSIGITYLVCDCFIPFTSDEGDNDLQSLFNTMNSIKNLFIVEYDCNGNIVKATITKNLPVQPYSDIFKTLKDTNDQYCITFFKRWKKAVDDLKEAIEVENDYDAGVCVQRVFGDEFQLPPKPIKSVNTLAMREHNFG